MAKVAAKRVRGEIAKAPFPADLKVERCELCGTAIVWCKDGRPNGRTPLLAVQMAPPSARAHVGLQRSLIVDERPIAFEMNQASRFTWHAQHCAGSFSGQAKPRKVKP